MHFACHLFSLTSGIFYKKKKKISSLTRAFLGAELNINCHVLSLPALRENVESLTLAASFKAECYSSSNKTSFTKIGRRNHCSLAVTATWNMLVIFPALFSSCGDICCDFQILGEIILVFKNTK